MCVISKFVSIRELSSFTKKKTIYFFASEYNKQLATLYASLPSSWKGGSFRTPIRLVSWYPHVWRPSKKKNINYAEVLNPTPKPSDLI